jgi:mitochondrial enoyl-[acyl-carrier protein] reductase / trans-2-enoyl-CoA reductase
MHAVQLNDFGMPPEVARTIEIPDPSPPAAGEALIAMEYAPINPSDLVLIQGFYGVRPPLPALLGIEGVARVAAIGTGVANVKVGDLVLIPQGSPTWASRIKVAAAGLFPLPPQADPQQLAMLVVNPPTAYGMLTEFVTLKPGDWVLQTGGNSGVGRAVIAIAKKMGLRTVSTVRRSELIAELKALGADAVVLDGPDLPQRVAQATGGASVRLALDCVAGDGLQGVVDSLGDGGTCLVYGAMSLKPSSFSPGTPVFRDLTIRGFWVSKWYQKGPPEKIMGALGQIATWIAEGVIHTPVAAVYPLTEAKAALAHAMKGGKVLFKGN